MSHTNEPCNKEKGTICRDLHSQLQYKEFRREGIRANFEPIDDPDKPNPKIASVGYQKAAKAPGLAFNFCPWCGQNIQFWIDCPESALFRTTNKGVLYKSRLTAKVATLDCHDVGCDNVFQTLAVADIVEDAKDAGWDCGQGVDFCPDHFHETWSCETCGTLVAKRTGGLIWDTPFDLENHPDWTIDRAKPQCPAHFKKEQS